jgi:Acyclic terpene utilisation family protein AtuA
MTQNGGKTARLGCFTSRFVTSILPSKLAKDFDRQQVTQGFGMKRVIRIGNAGGYWGDDLSALRRQLEGGPLDYITIDFLAEITMSILQSQRKKNPALGYASDFVDQVRDCLPLILDKKVTIITNAGGVNPLALGKKLLEEAKKQGRALRVGVVHGDDIMERLDVLTSAGETFTNMETGEKFAPVRSRVLSANVYLGAEPVVQALKTGCQIIVTGRVTDTGITVAPMIHEFGWSMNDWDKIAAGVVAGHVIECGCQASGGNISDWQDVISFHNMGYPIVEMEPSGEFVVTKHPKTGGIISEKSVKEQLVYEMGDPSNYISPDGIARFDSIQIKQAGKDRVRVYGIVGKPSPPKLKISMAHEDGWKISGTLLVSGPETLKKAKVITDIFWKKVGEKFEETRTDIVGAGSIWPSALNNYEPNEIYLRFSASDHDSNKFESFSKSLATIILSGPAGMAVTGGGRPKPSPVIAYWPTLIDRTKITAHVTVIDTNGSEATADIPYTLPAKGASLSKVITSVPLKVKKPKSSRQIEIRLRDIAYARSGDKGDTCNIGVLARNAECYIWLTRNLTADKVRKFFKGITHGKVIRYELNNLLALNFLLERTLGGGGTRSLMVDPQGKTLAQALLEMRVKAPAHLVAKTSVKKRK